MSLQICALEIYWNCVWWKPHVVCLIWLRRESYVLDLSHERQLIFYWEGTDSAACDIWLLKACVRRKHVGLHRNIEVRATVENMQHLNKWWSFIMSLFTEVEIDFRMENYPGTERAKKEEVYFWFCDCLNLAGVVSQWKGRRMNLAAKTKWHYDSKQTQWRTAEG